MPSKTLEIFDPAMCCPTGVCGPSVSPELAAFAADVKALEAEGVRVMRFNLAQQPGAFAENHHVRARLDKEGPECLPLLLVDGEEVLQGRYPTRPELADLLGLNLAPAKDTQTDGGCDEDSGCC